MRAEMWRPERASDSMSICHMDLDVVETAPVPHTSDSWSSGRGKGPRVRLERSAARVVELRLGGIISARVDRWLLQEG
ncbi:hypothetical protein BHE74_00000915 [Ensete ventricosum]|nr:hypothetical protein GW17_00021052 [Ensete ventricosum]RWW89989.1 hypothetical protein BHE74_00000915 [Ensete ventricosum]